MATEMAEPEVKDTTRAMRDKGQETSTKSALTARVVLPDASVTVVDQDTDDEVEDREDGEEADDGDFLADFPDDTEELELIHSRIGSLDALRLTRFKDHLKKLCLRQNFVSHLDPEVFHELTKLEELDFYDNKIKHLNDALDNLDNLQVLDLSFNLLRSIPDRLDHLHALCTIYFIQNKISKISGLQSSLNLTSLELGGNKIRKIEGLESLVKLEELWLGKNRVTKLENLSTLKKLRILSIQSNRITKLEGLEELADLEELYISHNGIQKLEGLDRNPKITTLDVGNNFIPAIENISHLTNLQELWMTGNKISDFTAFDSQLRHITSLTTLYLEGNPCQTNDIAGYRRKIILALPQLKQIDATFVRGV
ncbi:L domain-like protein [Cyathus striatus]|nr:L domain-like protein [Cyathus striatus]